MELIIVFTSLGNYEIIWEKERKRELVCILTTKRDTKGKKYTLDYGVSTIIIYLWLYNYL